MRRGTNGAREAKGLFRKVIWQKKKSYVHCVSSAEIQQCGMLKTLH